MPCEHTSKYFWPASGLTESDMTILYRARESTHTRIPITQLIARAVRETYGHLADNATPQAKAGRMAA